MKAFVIEKTADRAFLGAIQEVPVPKCFDDEVVIKVSYSSLNYKDALSSVGNPGVTRKFPHVTGIDVAGVVHETTSDALDSITNEIGLEDIKDTYALTLEGKSVGRYVVRI